MNIEICQECSFLAEKFMRLLLRIGAIMEVCGGQTHSIMKYNLTEFLPSSIELIHGPGCPVCVTPLEKIDQALYIASNSDVIFATYGDMLRVPGSEKSLLMLKAEGADVRIVFSPLDAVDIAKNNPSKKVVFFAIGFETTAPANALSVIRAYKLKLTNYSILSSHVKVPPALESILSSPDNRVSGVLAAGHVCTVMGYKEYFPLAGKYQIPITVTGFEPVDILAGVYATILQLEGRSYTVSNEYKRSVTLEGNLKAQESVNEVFEVCDFKWRGIGEIPHSGLKIREKYADFDAEILFESGNIKVKESELCISGEILKGLKKPDACSEFGKSCTPESPLGTLMVSNEGTCAAYYKYKIE
jgi:hydrogenase expression/formation protein HypD